MLPLLPSPGAPDLVVGLQPLTGSGTEISEEITLSATVSNHGDGRSAGTTLRYYRSMDATISTADTEVGTTMVPALASSDTSDQSISLTAPAAAGTYYYGGCVDPVAGESDTANNCSAAVQVDVSDTQREPDGTNEPITALGGPDLVVVAFFLARGVHDGDPGRSLTFQARIRNDGNEVSPETTLRFYSSRNPTITNSDAVAGMAAVGPLAVSERISSETLTLTAPTTSGTYYYGACVDTVTGESDTTNNCSLARTITVDGPPPDLVVLGPAVGAIGEDGTFRLLVTVHNQGEGGSAATTVRYYRSTDATITNADTLVGMEEVNALVPAGGSAETMRLTAPSTPGTYYYGACVDAVARESDTTNNCSSTSARQDVN